MDDVEFSAEDGARTDPDYLERVAKAVVAAGARTVNIPDTVGYSAPREYGALIGRIDNGQPFFIGNQPAVRMPANGQLFLGINDDILNDNTGDFYVTISR